jgi:hypothetical protein
LPKPWSHGARGHRSVRLETYTAPYRETQERILDIVHLHLLFVAFKADNRSSSQQKEPSTLFGFASYRRIGLAAILLAAVIAAPAAQVRAQARLDSPSATGGDDSAPQPPSSAAALRRITTTCKDETARFCPALEPSPLPRDAAICLKYYKTSLSLSCRSAVNGVTR